MNNLNELAKQYHERAKEKGFWDEPRETGTLLMLMVSELSEALEADRKNKHADLETFDYREDERNCSEDFQADFQQLIKDSFEDEIADVFIRLLDFIGQRNINIERHIDLKMQYNQTRAYKHGTAY